MEQIGNAEAVRFLLRHVGSVLRREWDPLQLGAEGPADEYDSYVPRIARLLMKAAPREQDLSAQLSHLAVEMLGGHSDPAKDARAARALLALREALHSDLGLLIDQVMNADGSRCVWLYQRPDGFYTYAAGVLRDESDENGEWSWWADAHGGESRIYGSVSAARHDAIEDLQRAESQATSPADPVVGSDGHPRKHL